MPSGLVWVTFPSLIPLTLAFFVSGMFLFTTFEYSHSTDLTFHIHILLFTLANQMLVDTAYLNNL